MKMNKDIMDSLSDDRDFEDDNGVNRFKLARSTYYKLVDKLNAMP